MRRSRRRPSPGAEARFWAVVVTGLAMAVHGWHASQFAESVGLPVMPGDGSVNPGEILERLGAYGPAGRRAYVAFLSLACLVPVAGSLLLLRVYEVLAEPRQHRRTLTTLAVLPAVCALSENTLHALLAALYPGGGMVLATLAYAATVAKAVACAAAALALAVVASGWLRRRVDADPHETI